MTNREPSSNHHHPENPVAQEDMSVPAGKIIAVALGALIVFAAGAYWSISIFDTRSRALQPNGPDPIPAGIGRTEIGLVEQAPFDVARTLQSYRTDRNQRLESWGWVDRKAGAIHMPIERAMELVVQESKK